MYQFKSIKTALMVKIGLLAMVPLLAITFFNVNYFKEFAISRAIHNQSLINQNISNEIHLYYFQQFHVFKGLSNMKNVYFSGNQYDQNPEEVNKKLQEKLTQIKDVTFFNHLFIIEKDGTIWAHINNNQANPLQLVGQKFKEFVPMNNFHLSEHNQFQFGSQSFSGQIGSIPLIRCNVWRQLYIVGLSELEPLSIFLEKEQRHLEKKNYNDASLLIINNRDNQIAIKNSKTQNYPQNYDWSTFKSNTPKITDPSGHYYANSIDILLGNAKYQLISILTEKDINYHANQMLKTTLIITVIALLIIALLVRLIAHIFVKPIFHIQDTLNYVAMGDLEHKLKVERIDELGQLSNSANKMIDDLNRQQKEIADYINKLISEQKRSEHLLLNILPPSIADRLKKDEKTIADQFYYSTVLFSDIVGFTKFSSTISAKELVECLNFLYTLFDDLLDKYHIEKIKTIGDALMLVSGVPKPRPDHAIEMAHMGLDMMEKMSVFNKHFGLNMKIRIGIHTGQVVAGVIGKKKFVYDLWGDTVNIASRMESHGIPGEVQLSETTYEHLKDHFNCEKRGKIDVKGKGEMTTYLLREPKANAKKKAPSRSKKPKKDPFLDKDNKPEKFNV